MKRSSPSRALSTLVAPVSWGTTYIVITEALPGRAPLFVATVRLIPAGVALSMLGWFRTRWRPRRNDLLHLTVPALCNFGVFFPLLIVAIYRLPGGAAAAVGGLQPLLVVSITWLWVRERPRRLDLAVGVVAAIGVAMVVVRRDAGIDPVGVIAAVGANVSFSIGVVATKRLRTPIDQIGATGWQMLIAAIVIVPLAAASGSIGEIGVGELAPVGYLSLVATALAFVIWYAGIRQLPTAAPPVLGLAAPLTGAALGWCVLGERLSGIQAAGFAITTAAIIWAAVAGSAGQHMPALGEALNVPMARHADTAGGRRPRAVEAV